MLEATQSKIRGCALGEGTKIGGARPYDIVTDNMFLFKRAQNATRHFAVPTEGSPLIVSPDGNSPKLLAAHLQDQCTLGCRAPLMGQESPWVCRPLGI